MEVFYGILKPKNIMVEQNDNQSVDPVIMDNNSEFEFVIV